MTVYSFLFSKQSGIIAACLLHTKSRRGKPKILGAVSNGGFNYVGLAFPIIFKVKY